ncbi:hypothetical protein DFH94DRAFT_762135 [Russula ochroleuca]|uniref:Secreted protein n=1 Tax=Russula ochroleuca TaxID=152965 RepID=A0A9P5K245_9AGAM|nr:hypothetical protein DFH94DRAFT_762135 [Russula ochroleuca]
MNGLSSSWTLILFLSGASEAQQHRRRSQHRQHGVTPVLPFPNSATFSADRGLSTVDPVNNSSRKYCRAEQLVHYKV